MRHRRLFFRWLAAALAGACLWCVSPLPAQSLNVRIEDLARQLGANSSLIFADAADGTILVDIEAEQLRIPASNMKLVTTAAAAVTFGREFQFSTQLRLAGRRLIVRGEGDPAFGDPKLLAAAGLEVDDLLAQWVEVVRATGISEFQEIVIDDRMFDSSELIHPAWPVDQLDRWYTAQVAAINFNNNCLDIFASPTQPGQPPLIRTLPSRPPAELEVRAVSGDRNAFWAARQPETNRYTLGGTVRHTLSAPISVTLHDPPMFFGQLLQRHLRTIGIRVPEVRRVRADEVLLPGDLLLDVRHDLVTILNRCNRDSQNLYAECLFKRLGHHVTSQSGSWSNGAAAVRLFLSRILGLDAASVVIDDGSGMSRGNRIAPRTLVRLLNYMVQRPDVGEIYRQSLAAPGEDGTLEKRFSGPGLAGDLRAKSGYLNGVVSLSGYLTYPEKTISFSIIANNASRPSYQLKQIMEKIIAEIDRETAPGSPRR